GTPKIVALSLDVDEDFIEQPVINQSSLFSSRLACKLGLEIGDSNGE
ncbi:MAG: hypothetical protein ACI8PT_003844, partial [Gammaproteobacteria bacterium]